MKKFLVMILALVMVFSLVACGGDDQVTDDAVTTESDAASDAEVVKVPITIVNSTGLEIHEMYLTGTQIEDWGDDVLGDLTMADATYVQLVLNVDAENVIWDVQVVDSEGTTITWLGIDFSEMPSDGFVLQLSYDGTDAVAYLANTIDELGL